ncbi:succinate dehydrogenase/fumarate reductase iron-sulfur subunit [Pelotomaculum sp. FP]|uniref:(Fe-S)-binding protein n=1 Tax=Pelotomaculum sp. FP TaxID=261474 RepID=UPI00106701F0|nr:(Fe-S)-binding protein [Pelotomaculum sp. FP]TEB16036.1 succinate dehydrogenase/fumarate reductase iron-sulfur subunit [Pelotomaculum sp. FP]
MGQFKPRNLGRPSSEQLASLKDLMPLPPPYANSSAAPAPGSIKEAWKDKYCASLDGAIANDRLTRPKTEDEKRDLLGKFLSGLDKLFSRDTNSGYLLPFTLSFEYCTKCTTCSEACHVFLGSGREEIYRPIFRSEALRQLYYKYKKGGSLLAQFLGGGCDIDAETVLRLGELAYRCNLCRRCAQYCPMGLDNGLLAREIRVIFSQEMGIAPTLLHEKGSVLQLKTGSSTGLNSAAFFDLIEFMEEDILERTGKRYRIPVDKKGADILLIHNAGEYLSWPDGPAAFAILFEEAGLNWTLHSGLAGYDCTNYGIWYDDVQSRKVAVAQRKAAKELGVRRIVIGECGHASRASLLISDRMLAGEDNIPRESCFPILRDIVQKGSIKFDPARNNFPVTLHDPCNLVKSMGIVKPQRDIVKALCPQFREMTPHGVENYCCGGGGGFAVMRSMNFPEWRYRVASRMKFKQILEAFQDKVQEPLTPKYVCTPCSNCKGAIRDLLDYYQASTKYNIRYGGLVELIVNAMSMFKKPYLDFEEMELF